MRTPAGTLGLSACRLALLALASSCAVDWDGQVAEGVERGARTDDSASADVPDDELVGTSDGDAGVDAPTSLLPPGPLLWFSADRGLTIDARGRVIAWEDRSGQGISAFAEREELAPGTQNDTPLPFVTFDGTQELQLTDVPAIGELTFFAVAQAAAEDRKCPALLHLSNSDDGFVQMADLEFGRHQRELYYESGNKCVPQGVMHTERFSVAALHVLSIRHEPSSLAVTRVDGRDVHSRMMELPAAVTRSHNFIGHNHYYNNGALNCERFLGRIAEIILYARLLDESERREVERYLSEKWDVPLQADP